MCFMCLMFNFMDRVSCYFYFVFLLDMSCSECDGMSLYFCVSLLMYWFVLLVTCLAAFVNCLVRQFAMCLCVVAVFLLNIMDVFSVGGGSLLDRPCMVFHRMCVLCL